MKLALFTNIISHYQISLGQAFAELIPGEFALICWESQNEERKSLGWADDFEKEWLIKAWKSESNFQKALDLLQSTDVVVWGFAPISEINERVKNGKLTFRYTERLFKRGLWRLLDPRVICNIVKQYHLSYRNNYHLLSVGPHCAADFRVLGLFRKRIWRWGYFPEFSTSLNLNKNNDVPIVLWVGRMLFWKRVDLLLFAAAWVQTHGRKNFKLKIIGNGPEEDNIRLLTKHLGLTDFCEVIGPKKPDDIGVVMEESNIYVFPSDKNEGWGVVVNEAMARGCCVIGGNQNGSIPWMVQNGLNGIVFEDGNAEDLGKKLLWCLDHPNETCRIGVAARKTVSELWTPKEAARRLLVLIETIEKKMPTPFFDGGPCSQA